MKVRYPYWRGYDKFLRRVISLTLAHKLLTLYADLWDDDEEPEECDKDWDELNEEEMAAASVLGYDEVKWNMD